MVLLASAAASVPLLQAVAQPGTSTAGEVNEDFGQGALSFPDRLVLVQGFRPGPIGWYLDAGASGTFEYRIPNLAGQATGINLWVYTPPNGTSNILARAQGMPDVILASNVHLAGDRLALPSPYATAPSVDIVIQATNPGTGDVLVIDKLVNYSVQGTDPRAPPAYSYVALGGLIGAIAFALLRRRPHGLRIAFGIGVVVAIATAGRMLALFLQNNLPLDPDAVGYRIYADRFAWWPLFDNGIFSGNFAEREPLYPMVVHVYFQVLGSSDFHLRVVSATLSIAVVIMSIVAARRRLLSWWGPLVVGFLVATAGPLIQESYRGLRLELEMLLLLALYLALDRRPSKRPGVDAILVGAIGVAMALTRTYFIPVFLAAIAVSFVVRYRPWPRAVGLVMVAVLLVGGAEAAHRLGLYIHHGDAQYDTAGYNRWNANVERFALGRPLGHAELFPTAEQYTQFGPYFGPKISTFQYLFVIHTPTEFARDSLAGAREIFDSVDPLGFTATAAVQSHRIPARLGPYATAIANRADLVLRWAILLGLLGMLLRSRRDPLLLLIPAVVGTWLGLTAFLFDHGLLEHYRHTWQVFPLAMIAFVWLAESIAVAVTRRWRVRWPSPARASWTGLLAELRPASRGIALLLLVLIPFGLAVLIDGRPTVSSALAVLGMALVVAIAAVAARSPAIRRPMLWLIAAIAPVAGAVYFVAPHAPTLAALSPAGVVVAAYLHLQGRRWALELGLLDAVVVVLIEPVAVWVGVAVAVIGLSAAAGRLRPTRRLVSVAAASTVALVLGAATASLAATSPPEGAAWSARLTAPSSSVDQQVTVDRTGDNSIWLYARRSSTLADYPFRLELNGASVTDDLNPYLPIDAMAWVRIPLTSTLREGDHLDIRLSAAGRPNQVDRFIEIGGVYATVPGLKSSGANGTYLIVLGDESLPLAPGGLPEPMVRDRLQPPQGAWMPGERAAPLDSREQASTLDIWGLTLKTAIEHPLGLGTGGLAAALNSSGQGMGPGLSARSELLQALAEWGVPGLAGLLIVLLAAAWVARRSQDRLAAALLATAGISMLGASVLLDPAGAVAAWLAIGLCLGSIAPAADPPSTWRASAVEKRPETSPPEAIHAG